MERPKRLLLLLLATTRAQETGLSASATLNLVRPCDRDTECGLTQACMDGACRNPCQAGDSSVCPMEGGLCKVVGHRPVCSCPSGTHNLNSTCTSDTSCSFGERKFSNGAVRYDSSCSQRCECYSSQWICQANDCEPGFRRKGLLSRDTDPLCRERAHPGGDECCVLWVCSEEAEVEEREGVCEHVICGGGAACDDETGRCRCRPGTAGDPDNLETGCQEEEVEENIKLLQITAASIQVQFPDITGGNLMYVESELLGRKEPPWENAILVEGNEIFTLTGLKAGTRYTLRWKAPDRQYPDLEVDTRPSRQGQKPKVIMTAHTFNSAQLSFDQFRPSGYTSGYVVSWRRAEDEAATWQTAEKQPTGDTPSVTIEDLAPGTQYEAKISIYEDPTNQVLGQSTELIHFNTEPGCVHEGTAHPLGVFFLGCESACDCQETGKVSCSERCRAPLNRRGTCGDSSLCVERPVDESNCCVLVVRQDQSASSPCQETQCGRHAECRHEIRGDGGAPETICVCREGYTGDPDSEEGCALASTPPDTAMASNLPACRAQNTTYSPGETWYDGCEFSCSCSPKLEIACEPRCKLITENVDSQCELKPDPEDQCCKTMVCPPATNNTNILQPSLPFDGCVFKGATYQKEERFFDGCEQQCQCMGWGDLVCLARCPPTTPGLGEDCYTLPDVTDSCCNFTVCDKPTLAVPDVERVPGLLQEKEMVLSPLTERAKQPRLIDAPEEVPGVMLGSFNEHHHGVQGEVWAANSTTIVIRHFSYDGEGPDVFFYAGSGESPRSIKSGSGAFHILPYPWQGEFPSDDEDVEVLGAFSNQSVLLRLPESLPVSKLRWISVWCRLFGINFGDMVLKEAVSFEERLNQRENVPKPAPPSDEPDGFGCLLFGQRRDYGEEWYDECDTYCVCQESGEVACLDIECPHEFGLDVIQPNCIDWDRHEDFVPVAPNCCPPVPTCRSDGSCAYKGSNFSNYDTIPMELSGCENRCYCEDTEVKCKDACYKLSDTAPSWTQCEGGCAAKLPRDDRPCCLEWRCGGPEHCPAPQPLTPIPIFPLRDVAAAPFNQTCIKVTFIIPESIAGQRGHYTIAYSSGFSGPQNPDNWPEVKIAQEGGAIPSTGQLFGKEVAGHALLCQLTPGIEYLLRPGVVVEDEEGDELGTSRGDIVTAKIDFAEEVKPSQPVVVYVNMSLSTMDVTATSARIEWRHLEEAEEKPYVDGVQLRRLTLSSEGAPISYVPETSPFIHRDTNYYVMEDLTPNTRYEVELDLIPVPGGLKELYSGIKVEFRTSAVVDIYDFSIRLSTLNVTDDSVEVGWVGVPSPDQKYVNIYRVIYHSISENSIRDESSVFKISKLDSPKRIRVSSLSSNQQYQIWLEAYLTNGKTTKSNVLEFSTTASRLGSDSSALPVRGDGRMEEHSYYSSMVAAAIVATFALMALSVVLFFYLRRHTTYKATITKERPASNASTAYDNSAFKDFDNGPPQFPPAGDQRTEL